MADERNFLLGYGEKLTERVPPITGGAPKKIAYGFEEARGRVMKMAAETVDDLSKLPKAACPQDIAVAELTVHPQWIAKSYYPAKLLGESGLVPVGSRPDLVRPEKWTRVGTPQEMPTTSLLVSAKRSVFRQWAERLKDWTPETVGADELHRIERMRAPRVKDKIMPIKSDREELVLEVVLHASEKPAHAFVLRNFAAYAEGLDASVDLARNFYAGGLCFVPVEARRDLLEQLATFSFLRVAREMPRLRSVRPVVRAVQTPEVRPCQLPDELGVDPGLRVAVFDGGIPEDSGLDRWVAEYGFDELGHPVADGLKHGHGVSSALLFGPLNRRGEAARPYCGVDHYRVLDQDSLGDPYELYDVLRRIRGVLREGAYRFANLSVAPRIAVDDTEVHAWTAVLDQVLADGSTLAAVAVGNDGDLDWASGIARVQVPSDCVNALGVGATDSEGEIWSRAGYSCVGPGRSPGLVKPDIMAFGGDVGEMFWVPDPSDVTQAVPTAGTSYASPTALRMAAGVAAHFGDQLGGLALKALLIHCAETNGQDRQEIGWGRLADRLEDIVLCPEGMCRVVYQGELGESQYLRAQIPTPAAGFKGMVKIRATLCFASETDPQDPSNYTKSGLEMFFRPHSGKRDPDKQNARSESFIRRKEYATEAELRLDAHKWETVLHGEKRKRASSLRDPVFDLHYNARVAGGPPSGGARLRYALVITIEAPKLKDLYNRIVRRYRAQLQALVPVIAIPIRV